MQISESKTFGGGMEESKRKILPVGWRFERKNRFWGWNGDNRKNRFWRRDRKELKRRFQQWDGDEQQ